VSENVTLIRGHLSVFGQSGEERACFGWRQCCITVGMITYRLWIHDGDWKRDTGRHCVRPLGWTVNVKRKNAKAEGEVIHRAIQTLHETVPMTGSGFHSEPRAFLERFSSRGPRDVLLQATGKTTEWRKEGWTRVPDAGVWTVSESVVPGLLRISNRGDWQVERPADSTDLQGLDPHTM
jgi:hypothetical protein